MVELSVAARFEGDWIARGKGAEQAGKRKHRATCIFKPPSATDIERRSPPFPSEKINVYYMWLGLETCACSSQAGETQEQEGGVCGRRSVHAIQAHWCIARLRALYTHTRGSMPAATSQRGKPLPASMCRKPGGPWAWDEEMVVWAGVDPDSVRFPSRGEWVVCFGNPCAVRVRVCSVCAVYMGLRHST